MWGSLSKTLTCHLARFNLLTSSIKKKKLLKKKRLKEIFYRILKKAFLKTYKSPPPIYVVKLSHCSEQLFRTQPGKAASILSVLSSFAND